MKSRTSQKIDAASYSSLFDTGSWNPDRYRHLDDNGLSEAFLALIGYQGMPVKEMDILRYRESPDRLRYLSAAQHVLAMPCALGEKWYLRDIGSFIGFLRGSRMAVVVLKKGLGYVYYDPSVQSMNRITPANAGLLSDEGVFVYDIPDQTKRSGIRLLLESLWRQKKELVILGLLTFLASLLTLIVPSAVYFITDTLIPEGLGGVVSAAGVSMLICIAASVCINLTANLSRARIQTASGRWLFPGLFARIMEMTSGEQKKMSGRLISLTLPFLNAMDQMIGSGLGAVIYLIQCTAVFFSIHTFRNVTGIFIYEVLAAAVIAALVIQVRMYRSTRRQRDLDSRLMICRRELIDNIDAIKNYAREEKFYSDFFHLYQQYMDQKLRMAAQRQWLVILPVVLNGVGLLAICIHAYTDNYSDLGTFSAVLSSLSLLMGYLVNLINSLADVVQNIPYLDFAREILSTDSERPIVQGISKQIKGKIELQHVTFSYSPDDKPVISDLNLVIRPGESIGIVGSSGSGKSTLLRLLLGFEKPVSGFILFDDVGLDQYNLQNLRRQFGVVMQQDSVYSGSIRMNIGMSDAADPDKVKAAAEMAAIADEIEAMPMKYNTLLSSDSNVVSGGQKQRIVLARALFHEPRILFLDEASSAMDNISQDIVRKNLDSLGITRINIAHRLSTIENCDRILVLKQGRIAEQGTYEQLMEKKQLFYRMVKRNLL